MLALLVLLVAGVFALAIFSGVLGWIVNHLVTVETALAAVAVALMLAFYH